jgi:NAD(P)-dependent dehydrogenase (short-subunit alcohol dehydrogenase family)
MTGRLSGAVAIVTGAARGQGLTTAELFASEGARVYAADLIDPEKEVPGVMPRHLDVSDESGWAALVDEIEQAEGRIDALVNNAATSGGAPTLAETTLSDWNRIINTNLTGTFLGMRAVIPVMQKRRSGSIVNIGSIVAWAPTRGVSAYHASKGGIRSISRQAAMALAAEGIRVNAIYPGIIDTPMLAKAKEHARLDDTFGHAIPLGRVGTSLEVAYCSLFLASPESAYIVGAEIPVDGGASIYSALAKGQET